MSTNKNLVNFENVGLRYDLHKEILQNINFSLKEGDFYYLVGKSGAGKTSFINLINLSIGPTRGDRTILGKDIYEATKKDISNLRRKISTVYQDYRLVKHINVFENIALALKIANVEKGEIETKVFQLLKWIGLERYAKYYPDMLSGGQQQCVALSRAIIGRPKIILADEPTGSIDDEMSDRIMLMLEELNKQGTSMVVATHNKDLINRFKHKIVRLENAKIQII